MRGHEKPQQVAQITDINFDDNGQPTPTFMVFARPEDLNVNLDEARKMHPNILLPPLNSNGKPFNFIVSIFPLSPFAIWRYQWTNHVGRCSRTGSCGDPRAGEGHQYLGERGAQPILRWQHFCWNSAHQNCWAKRLLGNWTNYISNRRVLQCTLKFQSGEPAPSYPKLAETGKLNLFDMFCGAGVLSSGLEESGLANVCWGLDSNEQCIKSFKANFPNASGLQMTADKLLQLLLNVCTLRIIKPIFLKRNFFCRVIPKMRLAKPCLQEERSTCSVEVPLARANTWNLMSLSEM